MTILRHWKKALSLAAVGVQVGIGGVATAGSPFDGLFTNSLEMACDEHVRAGERGMFIPLSDPFERFYEALSPLDPLWRPSPSDLGPAAFCFDAKHPPTPEVMALINRIEQGYVGRYNLGTSWTGNGVPVTITWSFVPDGLTIPSGGIDPTAPSILFSRMDTLFASSGGRAAWIARFQQCFDRWQALTGITYTRVRSGTNEWDDGAAWGTDGGTTRGRVRIAMHNIDGANGVLAYNFFPPNGDMVIDSSENWAQGTTNLFLRNTIMHEHGHGIGLHHVCPANNTKLMEPALSTSFDGPQQDDIRGAMAHYGDFFEPNNTASTATIVDAIAGGAQDPIAPGTNVIIGNVPSPSVTNGAVLSIDKVTDSDYFNFSVAASRLVSVTATPIGSSYLSLVQNANGSCPTTGTNINTLAAGNLGVEIRSVSGASVWGSSDTTGAGSVETLSNVLVPAGNAVVRVYATGPSGGALEGTQLYRLQITVAATNLTVSASDGTFNDRVRVNYTGIAGATLYSIQRNTTNNNNFAGIIGTATGTTFDDMTAEPGQMYYYWVRATQNGVSRLMTSTPDTGFRAAPDCVADMDNGTGTGTPDGGVTIEDLLYYLQIYEAGAIAADVDDGSQTGTQDGGVTIEDLLYFLVRYEAGC